MTPTFKIPERFPMYQLLRYTTRAVVTGTGAALLVEGGPISGAGGILFLAGVLWTLSTFLDEEFETLFGSAKQFFFVSVFATVPYSLVAYPDHPVGETLGNIISGFVSEPVLYAVASGYVWAFLIFLVVLGYKGFSLSRSTGTAPTAEDLE